MEMKIYRHDAGHMTKMAAIAIYVKNSSKVLFSGTSGPISMKLVASGTPDHHSLFK